MAAHRNKTQSDAQRVINVAANIHRNKVKPDAQNKIKAKQRCGDA